MRSHPLPFRFPALVLAAAACIRLSAVGQSLDKGSVEGALFYKEFPFLDDSSVQIIEYRSSKTYDKITYLETSHGKSMRISNEQVAFVLCYPGRGLVGREEALAIADFATARYPQFAPFIARVKKAWATMTPEEEKKQAHDSEIRNGFLAKMRGEAAEASQYNGPDPGKQPSLLDDHRKNLVPTAPPPASVLDVGPSGTAPVAAPAASPESAASPSGVPAELQQSLETIKEPATP
ncbi:hypothetical protein BH09VER1_BH09VER1_52090 [soil metagenome]